MSPDPPVAVMLAARGVGWLLAALLAAGVFLAPFWTPGIFLTLGAVVALFALQPRTTTTGSPCRALA
jgi:hypothetical protein